MNPIDYDLLAPAPDGRYQNIEQADGTDASGRPIRYLRRRFLPGAEAPDATVEISVEEGDRLDLVAMRTLGDPEQYWRICDANSAMRPTDVIAQPGRRLKIPTTLSGQEP